MQESFGRAVRWFSLQNQRNYLKITWNTVQNPDKNEGFLLYSSNRILQSYFLRQPARVHLGPTASKDFDHMSRARCNSMDQKSKSLQQNSDYEKFFPIFN